MFFIVLQCLINVDFLCKIVNVFIKTNAKLKNE